MNLQAQYQGINVEARARDYRVGGEPYQRVSTILGVINKPALVGWMKSLTLDAVRDTLKDPAVHSDELDLDRWVSHIMQAAKERTERESTAAAERGTAIHADIVRFFDGGMPKYPETVKAEEFLFENHMTVEAQEMIVWDDAIKVAGRCDIVLRDADRKLLVVDWKTGKGPYPEMALQLSAYASMLRKMTGEPVERGLVVKLAPEGYSVHTVADLSEGWRMFLMALDLQRGLRKEWWV